MGQKNKCEKSGVLEYVHHCLLLQTFSSDAFSFSFSSTEILISTANLIPEAKASACLMDRLALTASCCPQPLFQRELAISYELQIGSSGTCLFMPFEEMQ